MTGVQQGTRAPRFDDTELARRATRAELREYRLRVRRERPDTVIPARRNVAAVVGILVATGLIALVLWLFFLLVRVCVRYSTGPDPVFDDGVSLVAAVLLCVFLGSIGAVIVRVLVRMILRDVRFGNRWRRRLRLDRFARANGGRYESGGPAPEMTGALIPEDAAGTVRDVLTFDTFEAGTAQVTTGIRSVRRIGREWGFVRVRLERAVPHVVMESVASRRTHPRRTSRIVYRASQRLRLEGDFDRHFTVYAPDGYGADTLYWLTPDLMALLVDEAADCDIDVIDDWLIVSTPRPFDVADPGVMERIGALAELLGGTAVRRTARYADFRPGALPRVWVAPGGRRLRRRWLLRSILPSAVFLLMALRWLLSDVLHLF